MRVSVSFEISGSDASDRIRYIVLFNTLPRGYGSVQRLSTALHMEAIYSLG